jgi:hypothetical protein
MCGVWHPDEVDVAFEVVSPSFKFTPCAPFRVIIIVSVESLRHYVAIVCGPALYHHANGS